MPKSRRRRGHALPLRLGEDCIETKISIYRKSAHENEYANNYFPYRFLVVVVRADLYPAHFTKN